SAPPGPARASGIVGLVAMALFFLAPLMFLAAELLSSELLLYVGVFGAVALSFVTGLLAVGLAAFARVRGAWAVVGLVTGIIAALFSVMGGLGLLLLL